MSEKTNGIKDTLEFWLQIICAFILVKIVGSIGAIVAFISYFILRKKIGILGAFISSVILGVAAGVGVIAILLR